MNPRKRILPLPSTNDLLGGRMSRQRSGQLLILRMGNYLSRQMNHKFANGMKIRKGNRNTTTLLLPLKGLEILHQERRGQVKTKVIEHLNGILFHKSRPANKQQTNQSINQSKYTQNRPINKIIPYLYFIHHSHLQSNLLGCV